MYVHFGIPFENCDPRANKVMKQIACKTVARSRFMVNALQHSSNTISFYHTIHCIYTMEWYTIRELFLMVSERERERKKTTNQRMQTNNNITFI